MLVTIFVDHCFHNITFKFNSVYHWLFMLLWSYFNKWAFSKSNSWLINVTDNALIYLSMLYIWKVNSFVLVLCMMNHPSLIFSSPPWKVLPYFLLPLSILFISHISPLLLQSLKNIYYEWLVMFLPQYPCIIFCL